MKSDFLIIGQGLAGTTLAMRLLDAGASVLIIDNPRKSHSSRIAAGLFNPLVFRRITFGWRGLDSLNEAKQFYRAAERNLEAQFFQSDYLYRVHGTTDERDTWAKLRLDPAFSDFLGAPEETEQRNWLRQPFGGAKVHGAGFLDTETFLDGMRETFKEAGILLERDFEPKKLEILEDSIRYEEISAQTVVFCEGYLGNDNPWFGNLPFNVAKGEVLVIKIPGIREEIVNGGVYCVPMGNGFFKVGSTFAWEFENNLPTQEGAETLTKRLNDLLTVPFEIVDHQAGIRPTVRDRRPLIGRHPLYPQLTIFNGLGTKGVLMAPLLSRDFSKELISGAESDGEYSIERFRKHLISTPLKR